MLQAFFAAHPDILALPETNYITSIVGEVHRRTVGDSSTSLKSSLHHIYSQARISAGLCNPVAMGAFSNMVTQWGVEGVMERLERRHPIFIKKAVLRFIRALDIAAHNAGKPVWLDKSPRTYAYLDYVVEAAPDAKLVYILRSGLDVVASLHDAALKNPGTNWEKSFMNIDNCIRCWNMATEAARRWRDHPNFRTVEYQGLCEQTEATVRALCDFLEVEFQPVMLEKYQQSYSRIVTSGESSWKQGVKGEVRSRSKFNDLFDEAQREYISKNIVDDRGLAHIGESADSERTHHGD